MKKQITLSAFLFFTIKIFSQFTSDIDTALWYLDGKDSIYVLFEDTSADLENAKTILGKTPNESNFILNIGGAATKININPTHQYKILNQGLHGMHLGGMFDQHSLFNDGSSDDQYAILSAFAPETVRFPSGSYSKFTHLLQGPGYGYDIEAIIHYFDWSDNVLDYPIIDSAFIADLSDDNLDTLIDWVDDNEIEDLLSYKNKWLDQETLDPDHKYIDDMISLIQKIETENAGHTCKILLCLNIVSETASESLEIVNYLRDNEIYNCTVEGVEMGNETYFNWTKRLLNIDGFNDYLKYLHGDAGDWDEVINTTLENDHDYFHAFKGATNAVCKVGIPAGSLQQPFILFDDNTEYGGGPRSVEGWNDSLAAHYDDLEPIDGTTSFRKSFDAVIIHLYNQADSTWGNVPIEFLNYASCTDADTADEWLFNTSDSRLFTTYDSVISIFRSFIKTGFKESYDEHNAHLQFDLTGTNSKELWTTESNINSKSRDYTDEEQDKADAIMQTFVHAYVFDEWFLKNIKMNYDADYRQNFYTHNTWQNYAGGSGTDFLTKADSNELVFYGKYQYPYVDSITPLGETIPVSRNYYVKRTTHYALDLLSTITRKNLRYLKTTYYVNKSNRNLQPTVFIDQAKEHLYIYYTNVNDEAQDYVLNTTNMKNLFPGCYYVFTDTATTYSMQALQPYSTSGSGYNTLADLNSCYKNVATYPIEITHTDTTINVPACSGSVDPTMCFTVPKYSLGFIKVPIYPSFIPPKLSEENELELLVYPNPTSSVLQIKSDDDHVIDELFLIEIFNVENKLVFTQLNTELQIDVKHLPDGLYQLKLSTRAGPLFTSFIKSE